VRTPTKSGEQRDGCGLGDSQGQTSRLELTMILVCEDLLEKEFGR
jgi:hypothetical protein